jgi:hypothetical protein
MPSSAPWSEAWFAILEPANHDAVSGRVCKTDDQARVQGRQTRNRQEQPSILFRDIDHFLSTKKSFDNGQLRLYQFVLGVS